MRGLMQVMLLQKSSYKKSILFLLMSVLIFDKYELPQASEPIPEHKVVKVMEKDTTGRGHIDKIFTMITENNSGYIAEIKQHNGKIYRLKSGRDGNNHLILAPKAGRWELNIRVVDVNNDKIPEIVTWGGMTKYNKYYIFQWNGSDYKIIFEGNYSALMFKDITGDDVPEIVAEYFYSSGIEYSNFQWRKNKYVRINYDVDEALGFDKVKILLAWLNYPAETINVFDLPEDLKYYFTDGWIENKDNIKYVKDLKAGMLSIDLSEYLDYKEQRNTNITAKPVKIKRKFKVRIMSVSGVRVKAEEKIMEVDTELTDPDIGVYKISEFKIR